MIFIRRIKRTIRNRWPTTVAAPLRCITLSLLCFVVYFQLFLFLLFVFGHTHNLHTFYTVLCSLGLRLSSASLSFELVFIFWRQHSSFVNFCVLWISTLCVLFLWLLFGLRLSLAYLFIETAITHCTFSYYQ